jgi:N6-adenosine-specific RNA methylase IME4
MYIKFFLVAGRAVIGRAFSMKTPCQYHHISVGAHNQIIKVKTLIFEHIIFAVRGNLPTLCQDQPNVLFSGRGSHSQKPESAYRLIERMSPPPYLELFGRKRRRNWVVWGDEVKDDTVRPT